MVVIGHSNKRQKTITGVIGSAAAATITGITTVTSNTWIKRIANIEKCLWSLFWMAIGFYLHSLVVTSTTTNSATSSNLGILHKSFMEHWTNSTTTDTIIATNVDSLQSSSPSNAGKKHWCVVALKYLPKTTFQHFHHFPHASEILLPCWSYFMEQNATNNCGYFFHYKLNLSSWSRELIETMGCNIQMSVKGSDDIQLDGRVLSLPEDDIQFIPNLYLLRPRYGYIRYLNDASHAHELRRKFVSDEYLKLQKRRHGKPLQIGMIQRRDSRIIGNMEQIRDALQKAIPTADIVITDFVNLKTVKEQATWFATKHVIVAAHGAALTNSVFITQGTIVMQLFPPGYFWQSLDPLIEQSGGYAIQWYEKGKDPFIESATMKREDFDRAGKATFSPPVQEVVQPILYALEIIQPTNHRLKVLFGDFV